MLVNAVDSNIRNVFAVYMHLAGEAHENNLLFGDVCENAKYYCIL